VVDDLDGNPPGVRLGEGPGDVAVQTLPGLGVDLGFECGLKCLVGIVGPQEVGVADEKLSSQLVSCPSGSSSQWREG